MLQNSKHNIEISFDVGYLFAALGTFFCDIGSHLKCKLNTNWVRSVQKLIDNDILKGLSNPSRFGQQFMVSWNFQMRGLLLLL